MQVLNNFALAIQEQLRSLQYNQQKSQPIALGVQRQLQFQLKKKLHKITYQIGSTLQLSK